MSKQNIYYLSGKRVNEGMNIAIIEDSKEESEYLLQLIENWTTSNGIDGICHCYPSGEAFLSHFAAVDYQLVFLDIYMGELTGIDTAKAIRANDMNCLLVFLTSSKDHAWDTFPLHPFDYILKPCSKERLAHVMSEAMRALPEAGRTLELMLGRQKISFPYSSLISLEADGHYAIVSSERGTPLRCYINSFSSLWELLSRDSRFLLCNRGIILNMDYIEKLSDDDFILKDGQAFPIRKNKRGEVIQTFLTYQYEKAKNHVKRYLQ